MRPTSSELIEAIAHTLRTSIAPLVADQAWPASELRTIDALLGHLAARVRHEDDLLRADDRDLDQVLDELRRAGVPVVVDPPPDASLAEGNEARRASLEAAIHHLHHGGHHAQLSAVRAYLARAAERDRLLYGPLRDRPLF